VHHENCGETAARSAPGSDQARPGYGVAAWYRRKRPRPNTPHMISEATVRSAQ
jgi:hypothetical protein